MKAAREVPPPSPPPVPSYSQRQIDRKLEQILTTVGTWVGRQIGEALKASIEPMRQRIAEQSARIAELEAKEFRFLGTWSEGLEAHPQNSASYDGSLWIAVERTTAKPGTPNSGWVLAAKRGRDGRDKGANR